MNLVYRERTRACVAILIGDFWTWGSKMLAKLLRGSDAIDPVCVWAERDDRARIVLDSDLVVFWINSAALRMAGMTKLFDISQDRLRIRDIRWASAFRSFVRSSSATISMLYIPRPSDDHIMCSALNLETGHPTGMTGLTFRCMTDPLSLDGGALEAAFHLTSAELRVVVALFKGRTAEEASIDLRVSVGTIRAHIRHIYGKLDVASREAMFNKLLCFLTGP